MGAFSAYRRAPAGAQVDTLTAQSACYVRSFRAHLFWGLSMLRIHSLQQRPGKAG